MESEIKIHEAVYKVLKDLNRPSTYKEIWEQIKIRSLYEFAPDVDEANITRSSIEKKCVNSNRDGYPKNEILFYRDDEGKYDLYEKLSEEEKRDYILQSKSKENELQIEISKLNEKLNTIGLEVEKLNQLKSKTEDFNEKYTQFENDYKENKKQNDEINAFLKNFTEEKNNVQNLLRSLEDKKHQLNFTRLEKGFIDLLKRKEKEKIISFIFLVIFGILILLIPGYSIYMDFKNVKPIDFQKIDIFLVLPAIALEAFLLYFFRIILHNYNSIKEQILQLDNRSEVLKFISHYVIFKKDNNIKQEDISKFEEIIFSKISPDMKTIPTSPDVISLVEKIAKIVKSK